MDIIKDIIKEFITNNGSELLLTIITAIFAFLGTAVKNIVKKWANNTEKRKIVKDVVMAVEQMYKNIHGTEKFNKAMETASEMLTQKGIIVTELELMTMIEAAVCEFNDAFNKESWKQGIEEATASEGVEA